VLVQYPTSDQKLKVSKRARIEVIMLDREKIHFKCLKTSNLELGKNYKPTAAS